MSVCVCASVYECVRVFICVHVGICMCVSIKDTKLRRDEFTSLEIIDDA